MRGSTRTPLLLVLLLALCALSRAKISSLSVVDDSRRIFAIESFGFMLEGVHQMKISNVANSSANAGFLLMRQTAASTSLIEMSSADDSACLWKNRDEPANKPFIVDQHELKQGTMGPTTINEAGEFRVYFVNCRNNQQNIGFKIELTQYNVRNGKFSYLSAGEAPLDWVFGAASILWLGCAILWIKTLLGNPEFVKAIHHLMTALVCLKFLSVFFEAIKFHVMDSDGTAHGWKIVYYVFTFMKGIVMFTVILLIGTGWSLFKPFLTDKDKKIVAVVIPLQICTNIAYIYVDENMRGSPGWLTWRDLLHLLDIACCCAILFPIVWSIKHLRDAESIDGKAARNMERLRLFRQFYIMVVAYIYFTRIVVFLMAATLPFGYSWVDHFVYESATLTFFCLTGYRFQPVENNPYFMVQQDSDDEDEELDHPGRDRATPTAAGNTRPLNQVAVEKAAAV